MDLSQARENIEDIDKQMAKLFEKRMECSREIAIYKKENNIPIYDATREKTLIEKNSSYIKNDMLKEYYLDFFRGLLEISKKYQEKLKNN
jgi:monofunctional chorismate mutase